MNDDILLENFRQLEGTKTLNYLGVLEAQKKKKRNGRKTGKGKKCAKEISLSLRADSLPKRR